MDRQTYEQLLARINERRERNGYSAYNGVRNMRGAASYSELEERIAERRKRSAESLKKQQQRLQAMQAKKSVPVASSRTGQPLSQNLVNSPYAQMVNKSAQGYQPTTQKTQPVATSKTGQPLTNAQLQAQNNSPYLQQIQGKQLDYNSPLVRKPVQQAAQEAQREREYYQNIAHTQRSDDLINRFKQAAGKQHNKEKLTKEETQLLQNASGIMDIALLQNRIAGGEAAIKDSLLDTYLSTSNNQAPIVGGTLDTLDKAKLVKIQDKLNKGQSLTIEEQILLATQELKDIYNQRNNRTLGYDIAQGLISTASMALGSLITDGASIWTDPATQAAADWFDRTYLKNSQIVADDNGKLKLDLGKDTTTTKQKVAMAAREGANALWQAYIEKVGGDVFNDVAGSFISEWAKYPLAQKGIEALNAQSWYKYLKNTSKAINNSSGGWATAYKTFRDSTAYSGFLGETFEEITQHFGEVGILDTENLAIFGGDKKLLMTPKEFGTTVAVIGLYSLLTGGAGNMAVNLDERNLKKNFYQTIKKAEPSVTQKQTDGIFDRVMASVSPKTIGQDRTADVISQDLQNLGASQEFANRLAPGMAQTRIDEQMGQRTQEQPVQQSQQPMQPQVQPQEQVQQQIQQEVVPQETVVQEQEEVETIPEGVSNLSPEAQEVYSETYEKLSNSQNEKVKKAAKESAILFARMAETAAQQASVDGNQITAKDYADAIEILTDAAQKSESNELQKVLNQIISYHGGTSLVDKVDPRMFGTGASRGRNAHGWGFYTTKLFNTARGYAQEGAQRKGIPGNGIVGEYYTPEEYQLLDESKKAYEQSDYVAEILQRIANSVIPGTNQTYGDVVPQLKDGGGRETYVNISRAFLNGQIPVDVLEGVGENDSLTPDEAASKFLNQNGILGIRYTGENTKDKDSVNYVIFNPNDVQLANYYNQQQGDILRGQALISATKNMIKLFKDADESTFIHEAAHLRLEYLKSVANLEGADKQVKKDWNTLKKWLDITDDNETITTEQQEKFARGFEAYLRNGETEVTGLKKVFNQFKEWLTSIYQSFTELGGKPSKGVQAVMQRMVATKEELEQTQSNAQKQPQTTQTNEVKQETQKPQNKAVQAKETTKEVKPKTKEETESQKKLENAKERQVSRGGFEYEIIKPVQDFYKKNSQALEEINATIEQYHNEVAADVDSLGALTAEDVLDGISDREQKLIHRLWKRYRGDGEQAVKAYRRTKAYSMSGIDELAERLEKNGAEFDRSSEEDTLRYISDMVDASRETNSNTKEAAKVAKLLSIDDEGNLVVNKPTSKSDKAFLKEFFQDIDRKYKIDGSKLVDQMISDYSVSSQIKAEKGETNPEGEETQDYLKAVIKQEKELKDTTTPKIKPSDDGSLKVSKDVLPVQSDSGDTMASRLFERTTKQIRAMQDAQLETSDVPTYERLSNKQQIERATRYVADNPNEAFAHLMAGSSPTGISRTALAMAYANYARENDMGGQYTLALQMMSLFNTRAGQEIQLASLADEQDPVRFISDVNKARIEAYGYKLGAKDAEQAIKAANKAINGEVEQTAQEYEREMQQNTQEDMSNLEKILSNKEIVC